MSTIQDLRLIGIGFSRTGTASGSSSAGMADIDYFEANIGKVEDVDDLLADQRLTRFVLQAFGLEHYSQSRDFLRRALSEGVSDPVSTANRMGDDALKELVATLGLDQMGAPGLKRWDTVSDLSKRWARLRQPSAIETLGQRELDYFKANIGGVKSADDLMKNDRLYVFVMKAFGLEHAIGDRALAKRVFEEGVKSDLATANLLADPRWKEMATYLGLKENGGANLTRSEYVSAIADRYAARYPEVRQANANLQGPQFERRLEAFQKQAVNAREIAYFKEKAATIRTPEDLLNDDRLYRFVLNAFGLGDQANYKALMRKVITEGVSDPKSTANRMNDPRYREMVAALGFETVPSNISDPDIKVGVTNRYVAKHPTASPFGTDRWSVELNYYRNKVESVQTPDDLLDDPRLFAFITDSFDLTGSLADRTFLKKVLTEGVPDAPGLLDDPRMSDPKVRELAGTFQFEIRRSALQRPESVQNLIERFTTQGFEEEQGEQNTAVRLALTFLRRMPEVAQRETSERSRLMSVLADKALSEVLFTGLGLPPQMAGMDIDRLVSQLSRRVEMDDFRDPAKLMRFVERYATMHDLNNQQQGGVGVLPLIQPLSLDASGRVSRPQIFAMDPSVMMTVLNFPRF
jgi:hypothetical protein